MRGSRARERQASEATQKRAEADARQQRRAFIQAVDEIATGLGEIEPRAKATIERSVAALGIAPAQALKAEVDAIQAAGGMPTVDGSRKRTPGGIYLLLLKQRMNEAGQKEQLKQILGK
ncbi:MAG: phosphorylated adapter RNA export RNA-binding domain-containing protein [Chloroflexales bacterium]